MRLRTWCAAVFAALLVPAIVAAQDVTLTSRDGALALSGTLQSYDGEYYRLDSQYGLLTIDALGVICDGPACPDLTAPKSVVRFVGEAGVGEALLPLLFRAFAQSRGLTYAAPTAPGAPAILRDPVTDKVLAEFSFAPAAPDEARAAAISGRAELILSGVTEPGVGNRTVALDALIPIVARDNPMPAISTIELARALSGEVLNWSQIGGPDMPLVLHGLNEKADLQRALSARLGRKIAASVTHPDLASLAQAVATDPFALAVTGRAAAAGARVMPLTDSCGFPLLPTPLAIKAEDYPLTLPVYLLIPPRRLPLAAREFLEFLTLPEAQAAIALAGYIDRRPERQPMTADGLRLINAIQGAGEETTLADLKRLVDLMAGADRLSLTFRFQDGTSALDASSRQNLSDLAQLLEADQFKGEALTLAGFSDGSGSAAANLDLSTQRAASILSALKDAAPNLTEDQLPRVVGFGEALPMACDETAAGRRLNRRVEVWLKPGFVKDSPVP